MSSLLKQFNIFLENIINRKTMNDTFDKCITLNNVELRGPHQETLHYQH